MCILIYAGCTPVPVSCPPMYSFSEPVGAKNRFKFTFEPLIFTHGQVEELRATYNDGSNWKEYGPLMGQAIQLELLRPVSVGVVFSTTEFIYFSLPTVFLRYRYNFDSGRMFHSFAPVFACVPTLKSFSKWHSFPFVAGLNYTGSFNKLGIAYGFGGAYIHSYIEDRFPYMDSCGLTEPLFSDVMPIKMNTRAFALSTEEIQISATFGIKGFFMVFTPAFILKCKSKGIDMSDLPSNYTRWPESVSIADRFIFNWTIGINLRNLYRLKQIHEVEDVEY